MSRAARRRDLTEATAHAAVYLRRLRREQLRLALLSLVAFGGAIGALPLILYLLPGLHDAQLLGVPVPIWLVVVPPFPLFFAHRPARAAPRGRARRGVPRARRRRVTLSILAIIGVTGAALGIGTYGVRLARTTRTCSSPRARSRRGGTPPRSPAST